jgi:hypothetical protein
VCRCLPTSILAGLTLLSGSCTSDHTTGPDDDVPVGLEVQLNGTLIARIIGSAVEGAIHVHVGEYSGQLIVSALNGAGNTIEGGSFLLDVRTDDPAVATFVQPSVGALEGEIVATVAGSTFIQLSLLRAGEAAPAVVFAAPPIPVVAILCAQAEMLKEASHASPCALTGMRMQQLRNGLRKPD